MNIEHESKKISLSVTLMEYFPLWLKVSLLKIMTLGIYAPWGNQALKSYLYSNAKYNNKLFNTKNQALKVFKTRLILIIWMFALYLIAASVPQYDLVLQLLFLLTLPGFYLTEKKYSLNSIQFDHSESTFTLSLVKFYQSIISPIAVFLLLSTVIFNSEIIDSQFLASIDNKEEPAVFSEDSYLSRTESDILAIDEHARSHSSDHEAHDYWGEDISAEEIVYLDEHEKSHNHGNIALSRLQKYQLANQGNQFLQYALMCILILILWPWLDFKIIEYQVNNTRFLNSRWQLKSSPISLYGLYAKVLFLIAGLLVMSGLVISMLLMGDEGSSPEFWSNALVHGFWLLPLSIIIFAVVMNTLQAWRRQWKLNNLSSEQLTITNSDTYLSNLLLSLSNTLVGLFTLGFAIPWCHLRKYRYQSKHLVIECR